MRGWSAVVRGEGWRTAAVAFAVLVLGGGVGVLAAVSGANFDWAAIAAIAVLAIGLAVVAPHLLVALALPGTLLLYRVVDVLSVSDVILAGATVLSFFLIRGRDLLPMRVLLWGGVAYLAAALPTLVLNPFAANSVEWLHELVLVLGSMVVGFALGRSGWGGFAVGLYVGFCVFVAGLAFLIALGMTATGEGFGPVYLEPPLEIHKNSLGGALAVAIVLLYARPVWFRWPKTWSNTALVICVLGLAASGARQGMIGLLVGIIVVALRRDPESGRIRVAPWLISVPVAALVFVLVNDQLETGDRFNSSYQRLDWYAETLDMWRTSPVFGAGLRWWYQPGFPQFQPPNAELEVLSTTGVVGLLGFMTMFVVGFVALWRLDPVYGTAAAAVVATRFTQAQFDLYWVAGQASLLWMVAGIAVGALAGVRSNASEQEFGGARASSVLA